MYIISGFLFTIILNYSSFDKYVVILILLAIPAILYSGNNAIRPENGDFDFVFVKTESFSESVLKEVLLLPREKYFNSNTFEDDRQRLKKFYFDNGFFDVLVDTSTSLEDEGTIVNMKYKITENDRYTVKDVHYNGIGSVSDPLKNEIYVNSLLKHGEPYNKQLVSQEKDRIVNLLQNNGYFRAFIADTAGIIVAKYSEELQKSPEYKHKVIIKLNFKGTDKLYNFGKTEITITDNRYDLGKDIIERELEYKEGELYSLEKKLASENNFSRLSIIQLGRLAVDTVYEDEKKVQMKASITLGKKYELTPGIAAIYLTNKFFGGASIEYRDKNFFGGGRIFSTKLEGRINDFGNNQIDLSLAFTQPYLFNNNISLTFTPSVGLLNLDTLEYIYSRNLLRVSYYIAPYTFYQNSYLDLSIDYYRKKYKEDYTDDDGEHKKGEISNFMNSVSGITLVHNSTNDIFNPSQGGFHSVTVDISGFLPRLISIFYKKIDYSQYVKLFVLNKFFRDVSGNRSSIVGLSLKIGDIIEYGSGEHIIPVDNLYKFYSGGGNSLRGWGAQKNGILDNRDDGGKFLLEGSMEYRWNTFNNADNFMRNIWIVGFWDFGNVWESHSDFHFSQIAMAAGLGIRYNTFVGPIRIDVGFRLFDPSAVEGDRWLWDNPSRIFTPDKYAIHFGLGNAF